MNIDEMQAGPEIESLVAEKVMGLEPPTKEKPWWGLPGSVGGYTIPDSYSTDIGDAWQAAKKLGEEWGVLVAVYYDNRSDIDPPYWYCNYARGDTEIGAKADTAPMAICRAALKAVGA